MVRPTSVFVSYRHAQGDWVLTRLVPCLKAGGADVHVDVERFKAGKGIVDQMDAEQDASKIHLLVLSEGYFESAYCAHEFERACRRDPQFKRGVTVPVLRDKVDWRKHLAVKDPPLLVDLRDDDAGSRLDNAQRQEVARQWDLLLNACGADLGINPLDWLQARDELLRHLRRNESANFVVSGNPKWQELLEDVRHQLQAETHVGPALAVVDLEDAETTTRRALVASILRACDLPRTVPGDGEELVALKQQLAGRPTTRLALCHFDLVRHKPYYDIDFFAVLKHLMTEHVLQGTSKKLVLLVHSRAPFATLLPRDHPFSAIPLELVELRGRAR